ncbi:hypothetical protein SAMN04487904_1185 [Actinopolyspora lacussalsi subsp. righensis]|uniref:Lipoprotein n=1 Tax=Actinopolyspora righensis TaxID=995060 RepID=A0A1I7CE62_9ACTN|nr:hypothetical protein [Actinopolyspora righensis]SFT97661.1 hypothetical protein SAMN04487904_1185 [Actinopolyspora righensis]
MRRTTLALSALALITTLGACGTTSSDQASTGNGGDGQSQSSGSEQTFHQISGLVSQTSNTMDGKQTVTMKMEIEGGSGAQGSMMSAMGGQTCQLDLAASEMSCDGAVPVVMTEKAIYIKMPGAAQSGKPWTKTSTGSAGTTGNMGQLGSMRQYSDIESMLPEGSSIESTEQVTLNGEQATKYEVVTDLSEVMSRSGNSVKGAYELFQKQGIEELRKTVWIGPNDLPMRVKTVTPKMEVMGTEVPETTTKITYSGWGEPVDITVPPADKVQGA